MTARELIERLREYPPDRDVMVQGDDGTLEPAEFVEEAQVPPTGYQGGHLIVVTVTAR